MKIELNREGVREMLMSQEMMDICVEVAEGIRSNYGESSELNTYVGKNRVNVAIVSDMKSASKDNALLKAMK